MNLFLVDIEEVEEKPSIYTAYTTESMGDMRSPSLIDGSSVVMIAESEDTNAEDLKKQIKNLTEKLEAECVKTMLLTSQIEASHSHEKISDGNEERRSFQNKRDHLQLAEKVKENLRHRERIEHLEQALTKTKSELTNQHDAFLKLSEKSQSTEANLNEKIKFLTDKFTTYLKENTSLQGAIQDAEGKCKALESRNAQLSEENGHLTKKLSELEAKMRDENLTRSHYIKLEAGKSFDEIMRINNELSQTRDNLLKEIDYFKQELAISSQEEKLKSFESKCVKLMEDNGELQTKVSSLTEENALLKADFELLERENNELKDEQNYHQQSIKQANEEISKITQEKNNLLHQLNHYKIEFSYLQDFLKANTSSNSPIPTKYEEIVEIQTYDNNLTQKMIQKPKEDLKTIQDYMVKLDELEKQIAGLQNQFDFKNNQLTTLTMQQGDKPSEAIQTTESRILQVYKKIVEIKTAENQDLRMRIKEKSAIINLNVEIIEKLEITVQEKIDELAEASSFKEKLLHENDELTKIVTEKTHEIDRLYAEQSKTKKDYDALRKKMTPSKSVENMLQADLTPVKSDQTSDSMNQIVKNDVIRYLDMSQEGMIEVLNKFISNVLEKLEQQQKKLKNIELICKQVSRINELYRQTYSR